MPKITPTVFSESGDIDPRAVALPGQQSELWPLCEANIAQMLAQLMQPASSLHSGRTDCLEWRTGALLAIGGGALVLSKIDPGFNEFMGSTSAKVSCCVS